MTALVRRFLDIAPFRLEPAPTRDILAIMNTATRLLPALFILPLSIAMARPATQASSPPPAIQPDETAAAFIDRWNAWVAETDPDQQLLADLSSENDAIWVHLRAVAEQFNVHWPLDDMTVPDHWHAAEVAILRIAPHTARTRELLTRPYLALPFPGPQTEVERRAQRVAATESSPWPQEDSIQFKEPPLPTFPPLPQTKLEMYFLGISDGHPLLALRGHLGREWNYAIHIGNLGRAMSILLAQLDAYRLIAERGTTVDVLLAVPIENAVTDAVADMLHRHAGRLRDGSLETIQSALLQHAQGRRRLSGSFWLDERVFVELLPTWFDPAQPDHLNERGRAYLDDLGMSEHMMEWVDPDARFVLRNPPPIDARFAPASEQIRIHTALTEAYARDAARAPHEIDDLESARLFRALMDSDPDRRLAPALSRFMLYGNFLEHDLRFEMQARAALTLLGVHRHRVRTGAWPATLAEIDPTVMRFDPIDPHSGKPFGYAVIDDRPTLWSAGPDRDNDDGRPIPQPNAPGFGSPSIPAHRWFTRNEWNALPPEVQAEHDGDIILFPPFSSTPHD